MGVLSPVPFRPPGLEWSVPPKSPAPLPGMEVAASAPMGLGGPVHPCVEEWGWGLHLRGWGFFHMGSVNTNK